MIILKITNKIAKTGTKSLYQHDGKGQSKEYYENSKKRL